MIDGALAQHRGQRQQQQRDAALVDSLFCTAPSLPQPDHHHLLHPFVLVPDHRTAKVSPSLSLLPAPNSAAASAGKHQLQPHWPAGAAGLGLAAVGNVSPRTASAGANITTSTVSSTTANLTIHSASRGIASASASPPSSPSPPSSRSHLPRSRKNRLAAAMPGRPAKRSADATGPGDDDGSASGLSSRNGGRLKLPRTDRGPEDFSSVVKSRLQSYTRTGQACDRCKVRKIKCDALPDGCSHCINLNLECNVTDRVSGRTERRGYLQELEREKNGMLARIGDLEKLLRDRGVEIESWQGDSWAQYHPDDVGNAVPGAALSDNWSKPGSLMAKNHSPKPPPPPPFTPKFPRSQWESRPEQNHIGVGPDNAPLSSIRGTRLSLLGTTIDTTSFDLPDMDEPGDDARPSAPLYNKSIQAFLQSSMGRNPPLRVDLPPREEAFTYAEWYFMAVGIFLPVLHKPSFMRLLTRIYDEPDFEPSIPDLVIVHMVFATMYFHCGVRNSQQADERNNLNELSNRHYHFALSKIYDLLSCQELVAVQALALIASHTRAFPKPGCGSILASMALHRAVELNLHRSSKRPGEGTDLQNELRKRTWWVILTVVVAITGRRGCPLPVNVQDFDTDFPSPIADELLSDQGVDMSRTMPCQYQVGLVGMKIIPIFMEMYANIYSVRRDAENYLSVVNALEKQLQVWEDQLPESLRIHESGGLENASIPAIYARAFALELRLCLRHPSVAMTTDRKMMADNTRICEETAREFLECMKQLYKSKSLDTTWYQMSVYGVCIFSMLVAHWERRFETTPDKVAHLREEMQSWMTVLNETSLLLGCGPGISNQISQIIERTIGWIEHDMRRKDSEKSPPPAPAPVKQEDQTPTPVYQANRASAGVLNGTPQVGGQRKGYYQGSGLNGQAPYPTLAYGDPPRSNAAASTYQSEPAMFYSTAPAAAAVPDGSAQPNPLAGFASQPPQHIPTQAPADIMWQAGRGNTWHDWTAAIADSQERYSASALLTLGNPGRGSGASGVLADGTVGQAAGDMGMVPPGAQWPLIMFDHHATQG
ncbi:Transcriptional activator protein acu-15 [Tolypocladium ophioglossoides CBS 100239]|uniref:Transcriptional activator protein acu-15 n=1 Tax=Tolypocladium ophioglossoides (strain CBS 100239) TaxID=1163406 RepID=A0A0L0NAN7_TOLOC|nr:Transcriptional activator protein acu-15 [Tolypocladium ophioglossoides CBS 100239]